MLSKKWWRSSVCIGLCLMLSSAQTADAGRRKRSRAISAAAQARKQARQEQERVDKLYMFIISHTKIQTDKLTLENLSGNTEAGNAHVEFLNLLQKDLKNEVQDRSGNTISCPTSQRILRACNLIDPDHKIPRLLHKACIWYRNNKMHAPQDGQSLFLS